MTDSTGRVAEVAVQAMDLFVDAVEQTRPEQWDRPSNLEGWNVRELVAHATGSGAKAVVLLEDGEVWNHPSKPSDWISDDPAGQVREVAVRMRELLPGADLNAPRTSLEGEVPLHRALTYPVSDLALHSWDVHFSLGRLVELPDRVLAFCRSLVESIPEEAMRSPGGFGPAQPAGTDATPTARLMAYLGRSVQR